MCDADPHLPDRSLPELAPSRIAPGGCWGVTGPVPLPLWMRVRLVLCAKCRVLDQQCQYACRASDRRRSQSPSEIGVLATCCVPVGEELVD